ncbi:MAG: hypothetical protein KIT87_19235, partial [Anaerolineae bacterium]|nr:hypothetical protein [Anaerolineae bacterium]
ALDERLASLLLAIAPPDLQSRLSRDGLFSLSPEERRDLAVTLMLRRNKVTHIYELVKAFGTTSQVEYNRATRAWQRREATAIKHDYETCVHPFTGQMLRGAGHAPLIYAADPRADLPADVGHRAADLMADHDATIVEGWLQRAET